MPRKPLAPCRHPGCPNVTANRYCAQHAKLHTDRQYDERPSAAKRGYNSAWQRARRHFLAAHPFCVRCGRAATVVDHIKPHKGDKRLFWNKSNWQSLCKQCHDRKTANEDGGFGHKIIY